MTDTIVRLAPGRAGWYDEASRLHLTIAKPEAIIEDGTNVTNVKKAVGLKTLLLVQGDLDSDNFISHEIDFTKLKGKYIANLDYSLAVAEARKKSSANNKPEKPIEPEEPEVPAEPEEPTKPEETPTKPEEKPEEGPTKPEEEPEGTEEKPDIDGIMNQYLPKDEEGEDGGKLSENDEKGISEDSEKGKTEETEQKEDKKDDNSVLHEQAVDVSEEIEKKIENARAVSGVNGSIEMINENSELLSNIPNKEKELLELANKKKISVIESDIEKAEDDKDYKKIEEAIKELDKKDQKDLLDKLAEKQE